MSKKPKTPAAPALDRELLTRIVAATNAGSCLFTTVEQHKPLVEHPGGALVIVNPAIVDPANSAAIGTVASDLGKVFVNTPIPADPPQAENKSTYTIIKGASLPPVTRRGSSSGVTVYPFDTMDVGDAFFVAATAERDNPAKSLASTVSSANMRYATEKKNPDGTLVMRTTRKGNTVPAVDFVRQYIARSVKSGQVYGLFTAPADGALVQRMK